MRLFIVGAIVLIVFSIIATAQASLQLFSVTWDTWLCAALLSFFVDLLFGVTWVDGRVARRTEVHSG
jgi:uncharacterized integral membrane protein